MSNVYILPRNRQHGRPASAVHQQTTRLVRTSGAVAQRLLSSPHPSRMPMAAGTRRVYLAAAPPPPAAMPALVRRQPPPSPMYGGGAQSRRAHVFKMPVTVVEQSEEDDEFDMDEVYQLLEESAGHRMAAESAELGMGAPRRRERLTNLTPEEKLNRRKHKNRIAAQAARDRKKETTKRLEDSLKRALLEIGRLKGQVSMLRAENAQMRSNQLVQFEGPPQEGAMHGGGGQQQQQYYRQQAISQQQFNDDGYYHAEEDMKMGPVQFGQSAQQPIKPQPQHRPQQQQQCQQQKEAAIVVDQQQQARRHPEASLGSAASFSGPQQREREALGAAVSSSQRLMVAERKMAMGNKEGGGRRQLRAACMLKVLMALWSVVCKKENAPASPMMTSNCNKSSTSFLRNWTFQSMWTASATRSLKRELLRRMLRMETAKLVRLSKSPLQLLVAHLLVRKAANRKARGRQRRMVEDCINNIRTSATAILEEDNIITSSETELEEAVGLAIVPQLPRRR